MEGYMENAQGHLVPVANVREIDKLRDQLVRDMIGGAEMLAGHAKKFRETCFGEVSALVDVAAAEHGVRMGGEEGNIQLTSFDGRMKVIRACDKVITFTEGMSVAREIIFGCIARWTEGANKNLAVIVRKAFETDKDGHLSSSKIMGLFALKIDDADWTKAMGIIRDSIQVAGTKTYIRFYKRGEDGEFKQIALG